MKKFLVTLIVVFTLLLNGDYVLAMSGDPDTPIANKTIAGISRHAIPAVVSVNVTNADSDENIFIPRERKQSPQSPQDERPEAGSGTGFFINNEGYR